MNGYLLVTSIVIDFLRRKDKENTLFYQLSKEDIYVSIITHTELYAGKSVWEKDHAREELETVFSGLTILPLEEEVSKKAGYIKSRHPEMSLLDAIIAASAHFHELELVTLDIKGFAQISGIKLYRSTSLAQA